MPATSGALEGRGPAWRKLDPALVEEAVTFARSGAVNDDIAAALGVHVATFYRWTRIGRLESESRVRGEDPDPHNDLVCELYDGIRRSRSRLNARMNLRIVEAADRGEWRAAQAILARQPAYQTAADGTAVGADSIDAAADLAESQVTAAQARQVAQAMIQLLDDAVALVEAEGVEALKEQGRDLARRALLGVDSDGPPALG